MDNLRRNVARIIAASGDTDQVLSKVFNVNRSNVYRWRTGASAPTGPNMIAFLRWSQTDLHTLTYGNPDGDAA
jgi:hypothetical protein